MKNAFRLSLFVLTFVCLSAALAFAQATPTPTPDSFFTQITSSPTANSFVGGISGSGRFVVFESTGDLATLRPGETTRVVSNADGNREIFLYDYAQRRIFQITDTSVARVDPTKPPVSVNTTNGQVDFSNTAVEVSNNRPFISRDGRWIVFSSNADTPFSFNGDTNKAALAADGNQEIFLYRIPDVPSADLRSGSDVAFTDLRQNAFTRITNTAASRLPVAGTTTNLPIVADDNRMAQVNDRASRIVFVSTRNLAAKNADANPEIFVWTRTSNAATLPATGAFAQVTNTTGALVFNDNPSISGDTAKDDGPEDPRSVIAFISNATVMRDINDATIPTNNADGNAEVFIASFNGAAVTNLTQATRTRRTNPSDIINVVNPGPRISRDGNFFAFETVATDPKANSTANEAARGMFVYIIASDTFIQIGPRGSVADQEEDVLRFPVFTGDSTQLVFTSVLNFTTAGVRLPRTDATGLNPTGLKQIYAVTIPSQPPPAAQSFTRLTNTTSGSVAAIQHFVSDTTERLAFTFNAELGGGNADLSAEAFYLTVKPATSTSNTPAATSALTYFTGATQREVVTPAASPTPTPSPTPAATPITGLAPGMIGIVRAPAAEGGVRFGATTTRICEPQAACDAASESRHSPSLPVELAGVSLSINNAAAGLYFVSPTEIQFVVPPGLGAQTGTATYPVVVSIHEGETIRSVRSVLQVVSAQPDIFTRSDAPTRASVFNVTNMTLMAEPAEGFPVTTDVAGTATPTVLAIFLTGIRNIPVANITVRIGDRVLTGTAEIKSNTPTDMPGVDQLNVQLRPELAGAGDQPLIVSVTIGAQTFTSRPAETAPRIRIR